MQKQRFILAEFPPTRNASIVLNALVESREEGLRKAEDKLGPLKAIKVAEMNGVQTENGTRYMIFFGQEEFDMLIKSLADWIS